MKIPTISAKNLWHWGDLDINERYKNGVSLEGNLFSMSACPMAWQQIARLGGAPLHIRNEPTDLLDMLTVLGGTSSHAKQLRRQVETWALQQGLVAYQEIYQVTEYDDEIEDYRTMEFASHDEASEEAELTEAEIVPVRKLIGTPALNALHHQPASCLLGFEYALIEWARAHLDGQIQGVYWAERLDPLAYSAPRAGLFNAQSLNLQPTPFAPDDEEALDSIGEVRWIKVQGLEPQDKEPAP